MGIVFPFLLVCSFIYTFCQAIALHAGIWVSLSLFFAPFFISSGILLALGIVLVRVYYHEVKNLPYDVRKILEVSSDLLLSSLYLSLPLFVIYLVSWVLLGVLMAFREIPGLGAQLGALLSFAPFLLILSSLVLFFLSLLLLFFAAPLIALDRSGRKQKWALMVRAFSEKSLRIVCLFLLACVPMTLVISALVTSAHLTSVSYLGDIDGLTQIIAWFVMALPISLVLSPVLIFFFNFAAESYQLIIRQKSL